MDLHSTSGGSGTGNFDFKIQYLMDDGTGTFWPDENIASNVGDVLYFDVINESPVPGVSFFVKECRVSRIDDPTSFHNIIEV